MRISDLAAMSAPEAASAMLASHKGVQRNAEVQGWQFANQYAADSTERRYFIDVLRCICFGGEFPVVERREPVAPAPAYKQMAEVAV